MALKTFIYPKLPGFAQAWWTRIDASPLGARLARGAFWSLAGSLISRGLFLLASILVARILGKEGFGELGIIQSTTVMFGVFAGFGLGLTATKYIAELRAKDPAKAGRIMAMSAVVAWVTGALTAGALWIAAPWLAEHTLAAPQLAGALRISTLLVLLGAVNGAQTGALSGFESFKTIALVNLLSGLASFPLLVAGTWKWGLDGAVWGLVISMAINALLNNMALRRESSKAAVPLFPPGWRAEWKILWRFSLPALLTGLSVSPVYWICSAILTHQPNGYSELAIVTAAFAWRQFILFIPVCMGMALTPVVSGLQTDVDHKKLFHFVCQCAAATAGIAFVVAAPVAFFSAAIMAAYGPGFQSGALALSLVSVLAVLMAAIGIFHQSLAATGRNWQTFGLCILWAVITIALMLLLRGYGATGFIAAVLCSHIVHFFTNAYCVWLMAASIKQHAIDASSSGRLIALVDLKAAEI
jgi:O-antigen/teichoic acid export membrane protein